MPSFDSVTSTEGNGPVLLMSHGSMMTQAMFQPQLEGLLGACRMIAYDNLTWKRPNQAFTLDDLVEDCRAQLELHGLQRCVLLGMSMGGHMALEFARKYPDLLDALILTGAGASAFPEGIRDITRASFSELDNDGCIPRAWAERTAHVVFGETTYTQNPDLIGYWVDQWSNSPARPVYHQGMTWIDKRDLLEASKAITVPVHIIQGAEETAYLNAWVEPMLETVPRCTMVTIPKAGHFVNLEQPEAYNEALKAFLKTL